MPDDRNCPGILIFAGTTEGRELAQYVSAVNSENKEDAADRLCADGRRMRCFVCTATEYGKSILKDLRGITVHAGRMNCREIQDFIENNRISLVVDATHPFAREVTDNIRQACNAAACKMNVRYVRCLRSKTEQIQDGRQQPENGRTADEESERSLGDPAVCVDSVIQAVDYLKNTEGNILIATGSKELHLYTEIPDYKTRCFARVLSTREAVETGVRLGFEGKHLIAMQGPFSVEMNLALLRQTEASWFVTKESGAAGGFHEKLTAAQRARAVAVVVGRPAECGKSVEEVKEIIRVLGLQ